jgi:hypothetical protein
VECGYNNIKYMEKVIKVGSKVIKVLIFNKVQSESGYDVSECKLTFSDGSTLTYECDDLDELENENMGLYEILEDGTYIQIEDWE